MLSVLLWGKGKAIYGYYCHANDKGQPFYFFYPLISKANFFLCVQVATLIQTLFSITFKYLSFV